MCNCRNGKTIVSFLTPAAGNTAASASYNLGLNYYTCGNRKMCVNNSEGFPLAKNLEVQLLGAPRLIGNNQYSCDIRCICDIIYQPVNGYGCGCSCPRTETVVAVITGVPCGETVPTVVANGVLCDPVAVGCGCNYTNECALTVSFTLNTATN